MTTNANRRGREEREPDTTVVSSFTTTALSFSLSCWLPRSVKRGEKSINEFDCSPPPPLPFSLSTFYIPEDFSAAHTALLNRLDGWCRYASYCWRTRQEEEEEFEMEPMKSMRAFIKRKKKGEMKWGVHLDETVRLAFNWGEEINETRANSSLRQTWRRNENKCDWQNKKRRRRRKIKKRKEKKRERKKIQGPYGWREWCLRGSPDRTTAFV